MKSVHHVVVRNARQQVYYKTTIFNIHKDVAVKVNWALLGSHYIVGFMQEFYSTWLLYKSANIYL